MQVRLNRWRLVAVLIVLSSLASWPAAAADAAAYDAVIARALKLLPRQPEKVTVVDAHASPGSLSETACRGLRHARGARRVSRETGRHAAEGPEGTGVFDYALATIVWHEMAHIDGADETKAQLAEEQLWEEFVLARRVDSASGLRYLALLKKRR